MFIIVWTPPSINPVSHHDIIDMNGMSSDVARIVIAMDDAMEINAITIANNFI